MNRSGEHQCALLRRGRLAAAGQLSARFVLSSPTQEHTAPLVHTQPRRKLNGRQRHTTPTYRTPHRASHKRHTHTYLEARSQRVVDGVGQVELVVPGGVREPAVRKPAQLLVKHCNVAVLRSTGSAHSM